ncbi:hypothetical protein DEJ50_32565 [Streptomyces venezuelae]|uniref:Uncharacterized protein n=1 Tax=Streptomyces venezuelae TaxID=54571 RepID=A0A5P2DF66_STRVZ|nr:hypothetical protein DEJ50_32565 [Streptomyces venezuelae]
MTAGIDGERALTPKARGLPAAEIHRSSKPWRPGSILAPLLGLRGVTAEHWRRHQASSDGPSSPSLGQSFRASELQNGGSSDHRCGRTHEHAQLCTDIRAQPREWPGTP